MIREILENDALEESVNVLRAAFLTVADDFNLTPENCPTNPAFVTVDRLVRLKEKGARFFGLYEGNRQIGFVAVERASDSVYYMEKLAVLPEFRHRGHGKRLVDFVDEYVRGQEGTRISIGIMDGNIVLKEWYKTHGYVETNMRQFRHLPFTVCFMEKTVDVPDSGLKFGCC
jgi:GNAT superfamily N-acetyltransferase